MPALWANLILYLSTTWSSPCYPDGSPLEKVQDVVLVSLPTKVAIATIPAYPTNTKTDLVVDPESRLHTSGHTNNYKMDGDIWNNFWSDFSKRK